MPSHYPKNLQLHEDLNYNPQTQSTCHTHTTTGNKWTKSNMYADCTTHSIFWAHNVKIASANMPVVAFFKAFFSEKCTWRPPQCLDQDHLYYDKIMPGRYLCLTWAADRLLCSLLCAADGHASNPWQTLRQLHYQLHMLCSTSST